MPHLAITPAAISEAAKLPFFGQAMAVVRLIDPLWKVELSEERAWHVWLKRNSHHCVCPYCEREDLETHKFLIRACTPEEAEALVLEEQKGWGWEVKGVVPAEKLSVEIPASFYDALA